MRSVATAPVDAGSADVSPGDDAGEAIAETPAAPVQPLRPAPVVFITLGEWHGCAVAADGNARCWGRNREGQLGHPATAPVVAGPTRVPGLSGVAVEASAGTFHTCLRTDDGRAYCWGDNRTGQAGVEGSATLDQPAELRGLTDVAEVVAGRDQSCARLRDGTVRCWGNNEHGQLGDGTVRARFTPTPVVGLRGVAELAAGSGHTCARLEDGTVRCWGLNRRGQVGDRTRLARHRPTPVVGVAHANQIAVGREHGCARLTDGTVRCWGRNDVGQLGNGTVVGSNVAVAVRGLRGVRHIAAGGLHTCAVLEDATVRCWGSNHHGQLGIGTVGGVQRLPVAVIGLTGVGSVALSSAADDGSTCALMEDQSVRCWGDNAFGQLGRAASPADPNPTAIVWDAPPAGPAVAPR